MVESTYLKVIFRTTKGNAVRLIVVMALTAISMTIITGIGTLAPRMRNAIAILEGRSPASIAQIEGIAEAVERISYIFPIFFMAITALIIYMTMTRLIESERGKIGCLKMLGYPSAKIIANYMLFIFIGSIVGSVIGIIIGYFIVSPALFAAVRGGLNIPNVENVFPLIGIISATIMLIFALIITFVISFKTASERITNLYKGKAPKTGSKILFERIPFLWNKLKYKYKSTLRNIFRYRVRFVMTIFSILFSTALVFCGLALSFALQHTNPDIINTIRPISAIIIIAAILLNILVIYNITNINIEDRKREIATLMVLGYRNKEVTGYIFREIFLLTVLGILIGLPIGYAAMILMFDYLAFGGIEYVSFLVWPITAFLILVSLGLVNLMLFKKLLKTDMNGALKIIE